ncbi:MAG: acyloxyacyl hydrolase [Bacteroidota bacterium]
MNKLYKSPLFFYRFISIALFVFLFTVNGSAQFQRKLFYSNLIIETKFHYGFLYAQHLELELFDSHFPAFEISIQQKTYGKHKWERDYNYPLIGLTFFYSSMGNNPWLGNVYALMPFINFSLYEHKNLSLGFRFALGVGYVSKPFDRITNYKNLAIGSTLNAAVNIMFEARYRITRHLTLSTGISLQHFSNGSLKLPNYGLNAPLFNFGVALRPFKAKENIEDRFYTPTEPFEVIPKHKIEFNFGALLGYKNLQAVLGKNYWVYHIYENTFFQISKKSKVGFGLDLSYDPSHIDILKMRGDNVDNYFKILRPGINAAYQLTMSRIGFIFNLGCYLGGQEQTNGPLYEKLAVQYNFSKNFFATIMLKVHWGRADYIGWGLGYKFIKKYGKKTFK